MEGTYNRFEIQSPVFKCRNVDSMQSRCHSFPFPFNDGGLESSLQGNYFLAFKNWAMLTILLKFIFITCEKRFSFKYHFERHVDSVHEGKKPFYCKICDKSYKNC